MAIVAACMDESYQGGQIAAVGGYVYSERNLLKLNKEWLNCIRPTCIRAFHMTDCEARRRDFEFYWTPDYLLQIKKALFDIMVRRGKFGAVVGVAVADYKRLTRGMSRDRAHPYIQDPYYFCLFGAVQTVLRLAPRYMPRLPPEHNVHFVMDENDQFRGRAQRYFPWFRAQWKGRPPYQNIGTLAFVPDENFAPVQAADILVYEGAKRLLHQMTEPEREWRKSLLTLVQKKNIHYSLFQGDELAKRIEQMRRDGCF